MTWSLDDTLEKQELRPLRQWPCRPAMTPPKMWQQPNNTSVISQLVPQIRFFPSVDWRVTSPNWSFSLTVDRPKRHFGQHLQWFLRFCPRYVLLVQFPPNYSCVLHWLSPDGHHPRLSIACVTPFPPTPAVQIAKWCSGDYLCNTARVTTNSTTNTKYWFLI